MGNHADALPNEISIDPPAQPGHHRLPQQEGLTHVPSTRF
jgi:hypothetical protein